MRETSRQGWQKWRVTLAESPKTIPATPPLSRSRLNLAGITPLSTTIEEVPGPDGIRHALVARIRAEIAAGTYDTEERWQMAEERLLARIV